MPNLIKKSWTVSTTYIVFPKAFLFVPCLAFNLLALSSAI